MLGSLWAAPASLLPTQQGPSLCRRCRCTAALLCHRLFNCAPRANLFPASSLVCHLQDELFEDDDDDDEVRGQVGVPAAGRRAERRLQLLLPACTSPLLSSQFGAVVLFASRRTTTCWRSWRQTCRARRRCERCACRAGVARCGSAERAEPAWRAASGCRRRGQGPPARRSSARLAPPSHQPGAARPRWASLFWCRAAAPLAAALLWLAVRSRPACARLLSVTHRPAPASSTTTATATSTSSSSSSSSPMTSLAGAPAGCRCLSAAPQPASAPAA